MVLVGIFGLASKDVQEAATCICWKHSSFQLLVLKKTSFQESDLCNAFIQALGTPLKCESFETLEDASEYAMNRWSEHFVLVGLECDEATVEVFRRRPTFILLSLISPNATVHCSQAYLELVELSKVVISNDGSRKDLARVVKSLNFSDPSWLRPSWDHYFMQLAELASTRSNCMKRRVGAIIVQDCKVVATGYNGTPRGLTNCHAGGCPRCNRNAKCGQSLEDCLCLHAEENAMLEAGTPRIQGATIYSTSSPCLGCAKRIVQVGIKRVVFAIEYSVEHKVEELFTQVGIRMEKVGGPVRKRYISCAAPDDI